MILLRGLVKTCVSLFTFGKIRLNAAKLTSSWRKHTLTDWVASRIFPGGVAKAVKVLPWVVSRFVRERGQHPSTLSQGQVKQVNSCHLVRLLRGL